MLRPRERHDLRVVSSEIKLSPAAEITSAQDVFGNYVVTAGFTGLTDELNVESLSQAELSSIPWPVFPIAASAISYPFRYSEDECRDLGALAVPQHTSSASDVQTWSSSFVHGPSTDTLSLLKDLNNHVTERVRYEVRDEQGTYTPEETFARQFGSCRDMATLFLEATRLLGFGGRIVSGYLYDPDMAALAASDATHAWVEIYVPGAGWITFDPTNRTVGGHNLIPVAVGRDISQVTPISGSFSGATRTSTGNMKVEIEIAAVG
jgi:transglutaminase-like putative cysteine protease